MSTHCVGRIDPLDSGLRRNDAVFALRFIEMSSPEIVMVITNVPDRVTAERIADSLVTQGVAACVNILAVCTSVYHWEGKLHHTEEVPLLIKTTRAAYPRLEAELRKLHPYDLPELIALPVSAGLPEYLNWVAQETKARNET